MLVLYNFNGIDSKEFALQIFYNLKINWLIWSQKITFSNSTMVFLNQPKQKNNLKIFKNHYNWNLTFLELKGKFCLWKSQIFNVQSI